MDVIRSDNPSNMPFKKVMNVFADAIISISRDFDTDPVLNINSNQLGLPLSFSKIQFKQQK